MRIGECFYLPYTPPYKGGETTGAMTCRGYKDKERKTNYEIPRFAQDDHSPHPWSDHARAGTQARPYETTIMPRIPRCPLMGHRK